MRLTKPDVITVYLENAAIDLTDSLLFEGGQVVLKESDGLDVSVQCEKKGVSFIRLRWYCKMRLDVKCLGDAWERGYGDLEWRAIDKDRTMPWYMALSNGSDSCLDYSGRLTECFGVGVLPNTFELWSCDEDCVTLVLDLRNGCAPLRLGNRRLHFATIYFEEYADCGAFEALSRFCGVMCKSPCLPDHPIYGSNNWYYAYGNSSHGEILEDSRFVAEMCKGAASKPYMVIDDGWQLNNCDAPWDVGNARFPDMKRLADEMKALEVRPGIWIVT